MIKKVENKWKVDLRPEGRSGRRVRKTFDTKAEALRFEAYIKGQAVRGEWNPAKADTRRLSELCTTWFELHGQHIKTGHKRMTELRKVVALLGDPLASQFTPELFAEFRAERLKQVSPSTANHDLTNFRSLFNELKRLGKWGRPNPIEGVRRIKQDERELAYLTHDHIDELLAELDKSDSHAKIIARVCLATGARWGEACKLTARQVRDGKVHFSLTKSGKNRSVPVSPEIEALILEHAPLVDGYKAFKTAAKRLSFSLPAGQMTHVLRHTFASHFMMNGGNIITLQRILGHGSLAMTVRYAHLSPDHLNEAVALNPLASKKSDQ